MRSLMGSKQVSFRWMRTDHTGRWKGSDCDECEGKVWPEERYLLLGEIIDSQDLTDDSAGIGSRKRWIYSRSVAES